MVARPAGPLLVIGTVMRKRWVVATGVALPLGCVMPTVPMLKFEKLKPHLQTRNATENISLQFGHGGRRGTGRQARRQAGRQSAVEPSPKREQRRQRSSLESKGATSARRRHVIGVRNDGVYLTRLGRPGMREPPRWVGDPCDDVYHGCAACDSQCMLSTHS